MCHSVPISILKNKKPVLARRACRAERARTSEPTPTTRKVRVPHINQNNRSHSWDRSMTASQLRCQLTSARPAMPWGTHQNFGLSSSEWSKGDQSTIGTLPSLLIIGTRKVTVQVAPYPSLYPDCMSAACHAVRPTATRDGACTGRHDSALDFTHAAPSYLGTQLHENTQ